MPLSVGASDHHPPSPWFNGAMDRFQAVRIHSELLVWVLSNPDPEKEGSRSLSSEPRKRLGSHGFTPRSSSREVRISWYQLFSVVYFSGGTLPTKKGERKGTQLGVTVLHLDFRSEPQGRSRLLALGPHLFRLLLHLTDGQPFANINKEGSPKGHGTNCVNNSNLVARPMVHHYFC